MDLLTDIIIKRELIIGIAEKHKTKNIRVFGSVLRGETTSASDIDLLVDCIDGCSLFDIIDLKEELEGLLGRKVDIVTEGSLNKYLKQTILREAREL